MATYGQYRSVNKMVNHFPEDLAAVDGFFDPAIRVDIRLSRDGRYTVNGYDALNSDKTPKVFLDLRLFKNNTLQGVRYISNGLLEIDSDGRRYAVYFTEAAPGKPLPYSIMMNFKNDPGSYHTTVINLPSDHPFLRAYKAV